MSFLSLYEIFKSQHFDNTACKSNYNMIDDRLNNGVEKFNREEEKMKLSNRELDNLNRLLELSNQELDN